MLVVRMCIGRDDGTMTHDRYTGTVRTGYQTVWLTMVDRFIAGGPNTLAFLHVSILNTVHTTLNTVGHSHP